MRKPKHQIKKKKRKKERKNKEANKFTTGWKPITMGFNRSNQMRKPKHQTKKKKEKKKKNKRKKIRSKLHHQSLIWCKRCEIPCYYQQIRYITSSNVKNTFGFLWKSWERGRGDWFGWHVKHCVTVTRRRGLAELRPVK